LITDKVFRFSELRSESIDSKLKNAVVCFGHFNTIHPGHIRYFRTARAYSTPLVVALEGDAQLSVAEQGRFFPEEDRALSVATLDLVDTVVILDTGALEDLVNQAEFTALVLGKEFESARASKVKNAVAAASRKGIEVFFDAGETHYAGSELLYGSPGELEIKRWREFVKAQNAQDLSLDEVFSLMTHSKPSNMLVIGDTIVDRYVACDPIGMSNEAPVVVVKEMEARDYVGGAAIVAAHVAALGARCTYLSVTGLDNEGSFVADSLHDYSVETVLFTDHSRPTTLKIRYMVESQKLFRVSRLKEHSMSSDLEDRLIAEIINRAPLLDGILVSDFVYGVITPRIIKTLLEVKGDYGVPLYGDLQCSSQVGSVLKFQNFSLICPTEREARIALGNQHDGVEYLANLLLEKTKSADIVLKLGRDGFISYRGGKAVEGFVQRQHFPALTANPVDIAGAGDALLAAMATGLSRGLSLMQASALASCVAAIAVQTVGNCPISLEQTHNFYSRHLDNGLNNAV
jgi:rfaE bifunctional protein kinase chain/domain